MKILDDQRKWQAEQNRWLLVATIIGGTLSFLGGVASSALTWYLASVKS